MATVLIGILFFVFGAVYGYTFSKYLVRKKVNLGIAMATPGLVWLGAWHLATLVT